MTGPSSQDLHPKSGARFVFERDEVEPTRYALTVFLPDDRTLEADLSWTDDGKAELTPRDSVRWEAWPHGEALKLARVLKRDPKSRLTRWRGP